MERGCILSVFHPQRRRMGRGSPKWPHGSKGRFAHVLILFYGCRVPGRSVFTELARAHALRAGPSRRPDEAQARLRLSLRTRHGDAGGDPRQGLSPRAAGAAAALSALRRARDCRRLHGAFAKRARVSVRCAAECVICYRRIGARSPTLRRESVWRVGHPTVAMAEAAH